MFIFHLSCIMILYLAQTYNYGVPSLQAFASKLEFVFEQMI